MTDFDFAQTVITIFTVIGILTVASLRSLLLLSTGVYPMRDVTLTVIFVYLLLYIGAFALHLMIFTGDCP